MKRLFSWFERKKYANSQGETEPPRVISGHFSPANRLEELLIEAGYTASARPMFEHEFLNHEVLIAIRDDGQHDGQLKDSVDLGVYALVADDDQSYPVGFTALERGYECFGPETVMARMTGRQLLEMVVGSGLWVNPSSPFGVLWQPKDLKRILEG